MDFYNANPPSDMYLAMAHSEETHLLTERPATVTDGRATVNTRCILPVQPFPCQAKASEGLSDIMQPPILAGSRRLKLIQLNSPAGKIRVSGRLNFRMGSNFYL